MNPFLEASAPPTPPRRALFAATAAVLISTGCATAPHQLAREDMPAAPPLNITARSGPAAATLCAIIDPKGPGSWKHEAYWDEFIVSIRNEGHLPLRVESVSLVDLRGHSIAPGRDPWALEDLGRGSLGAPARTRVVAGIRSSAILPTSITLAGMSTIYGSAGLKGPSIVFGTAAVALPATDLANQAADSNGRRAIEAEFRRRRLDLPLVVDSREAVEGSFFFPLTTGFRRLVLRCAAGDRRWSVEFDLTPFSHIYHGN